MGPCTKKSLRKPNPVKNANILSRIFFCFSCGLFKRGLQKGLSESDIYEPIQELDSADLGSFLEENWNAQKNKTSRGFLKCLFKVCGIQYICLFIFTVIVETLLGLSMPILNGKVVSYFSKNEEMISKNESYYYATVLIVCTIVHTLYNATFNFLTDIITMKLKMSLSSLLYRKSLKLKVISTSKCSAGQAVTLITKDVDTLDNVLSTLPILMSGTLQAAFLGYLMYKQVGVYAFPGMATLFVFMPLIGYYSSNLALYVCIMIYITSGNCITPEQAFIVVGCFTRLTAVFSCYVPYAIAILSEMMIAVRRFVDFLNLEEAYKMFDNAYKQSNPKISVKKVEIKSNEGAIILNLINVNLKSGLTLITGPTGSGKSTFLKMLLGDANKSEGTLEVIGRMSYASQEPWLFPGTIRENIVFNEEFDKERYNEVVYVCALQRDFQDLIRGDKTYLSDRGLNLSRGQKTRINLARAIYKKADIYLLDDCLSAVDSNVAQHIFYECIKNFLKHKMCILNTHQEQFLKEADNIIVLNKKCIDFQGSYDYFKELSLKCSKIPLNEEKSSNPSYNKSGHLLVTSNSDTEDESSKLLLEFKKSARNIYKEYTNQGSVSKQTYWEYFKSGGGIKVILLVFSVFVVAQAVISCSAYYVGIWVDIEQKLSGFKFNQSTDSVEFKDIEDQHQQTIMQYSLLVFGSIILVLLKVFVFYMLISNASIRIHKIVLKSLIGAKMSFFDKNLSGNIINRLSRDLGILDEQLAATISQILMAVMVLFGVLVVISAVHAIFIIPSLLLLLLLFLIRRLYLPTANSIRRLEGATRSPVIGQFNASLDGLNTIRASNAESFLRATFEKHLNFYNSAVYMHRSTYRALFLYTHLTCNLYLAIVVLTFLFVETGTLAGRVGLAITQAGTLTSWLQVGLCEWAELENKMTSAERVLEYKKIETENTAGKTTNDWPHSGNIVYSGVNLSYNDDNLVLNDVSFKIDSKSKIGIVGRTGAGKTSIISTLFRLYDYGGKITIDGIDTKDVALEMLRSRISIIPQDPILFSGTIRTNLDPNSEYSDKQLWDALEKVELKNFFENLDEEVGEGNRNFSLGQMQLICLARAIIKNNIILVLDEATANIDWQTDALIQKTIKKDLLDCTVITIAHRLSTIMDSDKVIVIDSGRVIEYDTPSVLLANTKSTFYKMAVDSGIL